MSRRLIVTISLVASTLIASVAVVPSAHAVDTTGWTTTTQTASWSVAAHSRRAIGAYCPHGSTPIAGGVWAPNNQAVVSYQEYTNFGDGQDYGGSVENRTGSTLSVTAYVRCMSTGLLHPTTRVVKTFAENNSTHHGGGYTTCPAGSYALSARIDWNNVTNAQSIDYSSPTWDLTGWLVTGTNAGTGNYLTVDLQCVSAGDLPGAHLVHTSSGTGPSPATHTVSATCPAGMILVNGGDFTQHNGDSSDFSVNLGTTYTSYPSGNTWIAQALMPANSVGNLYILYATAWCLPVQAPTINGPIGPGAYTTNPSASFTFSATDPASAGGYTISFACAVDPNPSTLNLSPCSSPYAPTVAEGHHVLYVQATTSDGRKSVVHTTSWTYDQTAPAVALAAPSRVFGLSDPYTVAWSGTDSGSGVAGYVVGSRTAAYNAGFGSVVHGAQTTATSEQNTVAHGTTACYQVQAVDRAGNRSPFSAERCTAVPIDDAALTAGSGWVRRKDSQHWLSTYSHTTTHGARLWIGGVHLDRAGIVATTCSSCGRMAILVAGHQVGVIDLHSATTVRRKILALPRFTSTQGTVTLKVLSTAMPVDIDGLAVSQR